MARVKVTVDVRKAVKILKEAGLQLRAETFRKAARKAAQIARDDMRNRSGPVRTYRGKKGFHIFSSGENYRIKIIAGNLRRSVRIQTLKKTRLLWVGPAYRKTKGGSREQNVTIGKSFSNADGFYDKMMMKKTGDDFIRAEINRKGSQITAQLKKDGDAMIAKIASKANATP